MQREYYVIIILFIFMTCVSFFLAVRLGRYRRQVRHMTEELTMLLQEDTNYRLSSCCRAGKTQNVISLFNEIVERYRGELVLLKRKNRAYRESITSISHDIRTPLTSAKGYLQILSRNIPSDASDMKKHQEYIAIVEHRVDDVTDLLDQLFDYARVEAGEMEFDMERISLTNLFADTVSMFYDDFADKGCEPQVAVPRTPCYVMADRHALVRVIENLIKNAVVHGTGAYQFGLEPMGDKVCLRVSNRTDSIEQRDLERIFDRFYTTDTSRTRRTTGLGLAIVKQFAERMGGTVDAVLEEGIFTVEIVFLMLRNG